MKLLRIGIVLSIVFLAIFGLGVALGFLQADGIEAWMHSLAEHPRGKLWIGLGVIGVLAADIALGVPATPVMVGAGALLGPWWGGACSAIGATLAGVIGYVVCAALGQSAFKKYVSEEQATRAQQWLDRYGLLAMVIVRGLPILPEVAACLAGLSRVGFWRFTLIFAGVTIPWAMLHAVAGAYDPWLAVGVILGLPALAWVVGRALLKRPSPECD